jgi:hypothetical protein
LLPGAGGFARFIWVFLCVHDAFLIELVVWVQSHFATDLFNQIGVESAQTETHHRGGGWLSYQAKSWTQNHVIWLRHAVG